jgi:hypothetical protein
MMAGDAAVDVRQNDMGRSFFVIPRTDIKPGEKLSFTVTGLPRARASERWAKVIVGLVVVCLLAGAVGFTLIVNARGQDKTVRATGLGARRKQLTAEREKLYDQLVDLEKKRAAQRVDGDEYVSVRQTVVARLTLVLRELDQLDTGSA